MSKRHTNSGKSVKERLLNLSKAENYNPQMMISRYMQERLLYRRSISNYRERFILKGVVAPDVNKNEKIGPKPSR